MQPQAKQIGWWKSWQHFEQRINNDHREKKTIVWRLNPSWVKRAVLESNRVFTSCLPVQPSGRKRESFPSEFSSSLLSLALCHWWWCHSGRGECKPTHSVCDSYTSYTHSHTLERIFFLPFLPPLTSCDYFHPTRPGWQNKWKRSTTLVFEESVNTPWILWTKWTNSAVVTKAGSLCHSCSDKVKTISA